MSDLQNQLNLLNDYVRTLERENQSKSNQIRTLTSQNNQLIQQCQQLRNRARQSTTTTLVHSSSSSNLSNNNQLQATIQKLQNQLKQSKAAYTLLVEQSAAGNQTQRLRQSVRRLQEEKYILEQYKIKLQKDLREMGFKNIESYIQKMKQLQKLISDSTGKLKVYQTKIVDYQRKITLLNNEVVIKGSQMQRLNDKIKTLTESNSQQYKIVSNSNDLKIQQYQKKVTQLSNQISIQKSQIQRLKEKQSQIIIIQRQNQSLKRQVQNLNVKINSSVTINTQISSLQVTINSLQNQQKQWTRQKQQLLIKISDLQTQVVQKSNTIAQLRLRQDFLKSKQSQQSTNSKEIQNLNNIIRVLRIQIQDHKRTISYRQGTIKNLQSKISSHEYSKSSEISSIQRVVDEKNLQINRIIQSHNQKITQLSLQIQRYKSMSIVNSQSASQLTSLREQNAFLKRQSQNNQLLIQQLQRQKQSLKMRIRELDQLLIKARQTHVSEVKTYTTATDSNQNQLVNVVRELRTQLQQVKRSNAVIHEQNYHMQKYLAQLSQSQIQIPYFGNQASIVRYHSPQNATSLHHEFSNLNSPSQLRLNLQNQSSLLRKSKHYHQPYFKSQMNIQKKRQQRNDKSVMSPVRDTKSPNNYNSSSSININQNKSKWENLQRKISALRIQNDELKRTLLYE